MKSLWKELRKIETWKTLAPFIACAIIFWFLPNWIGGFIILGGYLTFKFIKDEKSSHKKE